MSASAVAGSVELRTCKSCKQAKPVDDFRPKRGFGRRGKLGRNCQECRVKHRDPTLPEPRYWIRHHAVERYIERCAPHLSINKARLEMIRRMDGAPLRRRPPWWLAAGVARPGEGMIEGYLMVDARTVFAVGVYPGDRKAGREPRVKTVLVREDLATIARKRLRFIWRRFWSLGDRLRSRRLGLPRKRPDADRSRAPSGNHGDTAHS